ncbi:methyltransferase domain-containing protein [Paenibacillus radicis (ex Gao et al. 2016)]|uniref:Methyltransferase n=1 Tax=Paenibacillus radicis (ex Gao et al. 2016) TaxID=1737354 RepID=A0A917M5K8_9BACL|nr:methyltransferase domain-containing protein [Paenibacillus radicis (ex Gao et al. 2016)]GGG78639.1 methyltransferase [Paenibacillus radicis (ex Gao et al. 2016)]
MGEYYWDTQIEYLRNSRDLFYNDDYIEFLVKSVWKIEAPVHLVDFGCGYGYLGLKLLPLLPEGSTYTDLGGKLLDEARAIFAQLPYQTEFLQGDIQEIGLERKYDLAICHAFLLHVPNPKMILQKMVDCVVDTGKVITFEPHWIANASNFYLHGHEQSDFFQLGLLQKLYEQDAARCCKDGNIGMKIPVYLSQLGLKDIECRVSDKVNFLHPHMEADSKNRMYNRLAESGYAAAPGEERDVYISGLIERVASQEEAVIQYENELLLSKEFHIESYLTYASNMKITFGSVVR